jgi:hypothetical protein
VVRIKIRTDQCEKSKKAGGVIFEFSPGLTGERPGPDLSAIFSYKMYNIKLKNASFCCQN